MNYEKLSQYKDTKNEIKHLKQRIAELQSRLCSPSSPSFDAIPVAPSVLSSSLEQGVLKLDELKTEYINLLESLIGQQIEIERAIKKLEPLERDLIRYRYFDGMKWDDVYKKLGYSQKQTHRIHRRVIAKLCDTVKDDNQ